MIGHFSLAVVLNRGTLFISPSSFLYFKFPMLNVVYFSDPWSLATPYHLVTSWEEAKMRGVNHNKSEHRTWYNTNSCQDTTFTRQRISSRQNNSTFFSTMASNCPLFWGTKGKETSEAPSFSRSGESDVEVSSSLFRLQNNANQIFLFRRECGIYPSLESLATLPVACRGLIHGLSL